MSKKSKKPDAPAQPVKTVEQPQPCLKEATASTTEGLSATLVVTENYIYGQDPEVLPDDDPRKGTVSDPNMQDRAWVNRNFTFNLKRR